MAVSDVQIAKLALQYIGDRYDITSLTEATPEAEQVNLVYEDIRDALLREHPWKFALRYYTPALLSGTPPAGWANMYAYPPDALKVIRMVHPLDPLQKRYPPLEWTVSRSSTDAKVLVTNESEPEFEYTKQVTVPTEFDALFDLALSWRIAAAICLPLTGDAQLADRMVRESERHTGVAKMEDSNEGSVGRVTREPDWITARN